VPRAWAEVDLGAVRHNVGLLVAATAPAAVCAVVKADGYGHGAVPVARAAVDAGARWLAVATAEEAAELRAAGFDLPVLLLSEPPPDEVDEVVGLALRTTVYSEVAIEQLAKAVARGGGARLRVHLKIDTGMHRVGADVAAAVDRARAVLERPELDLEGVWTHLAVADEPGNPFTGQQLVRFDAAVAALAHAGVRPAVVHAANSAAALVLPAARRDLVRCGIAVYGVPPAPALADCLALRPTLSLKARVAMVRVVPRGDGISYGLHHRCERDSVIATVPVGYADGVPRALFREGGDVLIRGRRRPMAGAVTMDQLMVDCGPAGDPAAEAVTAGDEAVLIGAQGDEWVTADEWAAKLGTIAYEVVCRIGARVPRVYT